MKNKEKEGKEDYLKSKGAVVVGRKLEQEMLSVKISLKQLEREEICELGSKVIDRDAAWYRR